MASQLEDVLKFQYIYVPRGTEKDTIEPGKQLGLLVAREHRAHLTVLAPRKDSVAHHPELAKLDVVTERSGYPQDGGVVLAWCPTYKVMEKIQHLEKSVVVLVEWIPGEFDAWAKLRSAYNTVTTKVMDAGLTADALTALERIVFEGYNGWTKATDVRLTRAFLDDLAKAGAYDRELVLAYARQTKSEDSIDRLKKVLDAFEASKASAPAATDAAFPTSRNW